LSKPRLFFGEPRSARLSKKQLGFKRLKTAVTAIPYWVVREAKAMLGFLSSI
jgi:hypothetical protein